MHLEKLKNHRAAEVLMGDKKIQRTKERAGRKSVFVLRMNSTVMQAQTSLERRRNDRHIEQLKQKGQAQQRGDPFSGRGKTRKMVGSWLLT